MADIDYTELAEIAQELIDSNGRSVTFNRFDQTPTDPGKPWNGPTDPRGTPDETDTVRAVFLPAGNSSFLGKGVIDEDLLKKSNEVAMVGPDVDFDLTTANEIDDAGIKKKISFVQELKPNVVTLLYFVGVAR